MGRACRENQDAETVKFTDSAGREVEIPKNIERIAPTGALAQIVLFSVSPDKMVGISTEWSDDAKEIFMGQIGLLDEQEKKHLIQEVLTPNGYNMMVTPKEVDADIEDLSKSIATGIDLALHQGLLTGCTQ